MLVVMIYIQPDLPVELWSNWPSLGEVCWACQLNTVPPGVHSSPPAPSFNLILGD